MARRKRRASRHQKGLETVPEKLLVKIIEARLAGKRARRDPEPDLIGGWPPVWWSTRGMGKAFTDAQLAAETILKNPPVGTQGKFIRIPAIQEAKELKKQWLEAWPEVADFFEHTHARKPKMHTARRGVLVCSGAGCPICETPITLSGRLVSSAPNVQNIPKPRFDVAYAELEMRLFAELQGAKEKA